MFYKAASDYKSDSNYPTCFVVFIPEKCVLVPHVSSALPGVLICDICPCVGRTSPLTQTAACQTLSVSPRRSLVSPCPPSTSFSRTGSWRSGVDEPLLLWTSQLCRRTNPRKPPKLPDFVMRKFLFEVQPCIFISDHKSVSSHGKYSTASTFQSFSYCMRNHLLTVLTTVVQTPALSPFVIPRIRSKAVLSVGVVLLSPYITVMQVNSISPETPFNWKHKRCSPLTSPHPILQSVDVVWALRAECKVVDIVYMF